MSQLLVTHCEDLISNNQNGRLEKVTRIAWMPIDRLIKIYPRCSELIHVLS